MMKFNKSRFFCLILLASLSFIAYGEDASSLFKEMSGYWRSNSVDIDINTEALGKESRIYKKSQSDFLTEAHYIDGVMYIKKLMLDNVCDNPNMQSSIEFIEYNDSCKEYIRQNFRFAGPMYFENGILEGALYYPGEEILNSRNTVERKPLNLLKIECKDDKLTFIVEDVDGGMAGYSNYDYVETMEFGKVSAEGFEQEADSWVNYYMVYNLAKASNGNMFSEEDFKLEYSKLKKGEQSYLKNGYYMISNLRRFIKSLEGKWIYSNIAKRQDNDIKFRAVSNFGVDLLMNFSSLDHGLFKDFVIEMSTLRIEDFRYMYMFENAKGRKSFIKDLKRLSPSQFPHVTTDGYKEAKPLQRLHIDIQERRLYYYKINEFLEETENGFLFTRYFSIYYIDLPNDGIIPKNIEWKSDYSKYSEYVIIKKPVPLKWVISDDESQIEEYSKYPDREWQLTSYMRRTND